MAPRLLDAITGLLLLNLASAFIRGGIDLRIFGVTLHTPSFRLSVLLLVVWVGTRFAARHRARLDPAVAGTYVRAHIPESIVALVFFIGLIIRLIGVGYGDPLVLHPDEHQVVGVAVTMLKNGSLAPPVPYHYPTVFHYLLLPAFGLVYVRGKSRGLWSSLEEIQVDTFQFYEVARAHSAVLGALTIVLTFVLAKRMWPDDRGRWAGAVAAACVAFSFIHVKESHNGVTDAALTFFIVLAVIAIVRALHLGSRSAFALAGFAAGIACATKYSALPVVPCVLAAHFLARDRWTDWRRLAVGLAAIPVGFFTGYPYALLNWPPFLEHLGWMSSHSGSRVFDPNARFELIVKYAMESGMGAIFTLTLGAAIARALYRRRAEESLALVFIVFALSLLSKTAFPFYGRYLVTILPLAAVLVGSLVVDVAAWVQRTAGARGSVFGPAFATLAVVALVMSPARESFSFVRYVTSPVTRVQTYHYILQHVPKGATVATEEPYLALPPGYELIRWTPLHRRSLEEFEQRGVDVVVFSADRDAVSDKEDAERRRELRRRFPMQAAFPGTGSHVGPTLQVHVSPF